MHVTTVSILLFMSLAGGVRADPISEAEHKTLEGFAAANTTCLEWTDGCAVCLRHDDKFDCSLPGIACEPTGLTCKAVTKPDVSPTPAK